MFRDAVTVEETLQTTSHDLDEFLSHYKWCLNPFLTFEELWVRADEEIERLRESEIAWQIQETKINLYIFACAISCTIDDHLTRIGWSLKPLGRFFPSAVPFLSLVERVIGFTLSLISFVRFRRLWGWKAGFDEFLERICRLLYSQEDFARKILPSLKGELRRLQMYPFPHSLLKARMKLNEGFRCQDLNPFDVITLANKFLTNCPLGGDRYVIVGARTAGSYFAPLLKVYLEDRGLSNVSSVSVRPRYGARGQERKLLKHLLKNGAKVILTDDYSNSGRTLAMLKDIVASFGIRSEDIAILAPVHPAREMKEMVADDDIRVVSLDQNELQVTKSMEPNAVASLLTEFFDANRGRSISVKETPWTETTNQALWSHYGDGFQVRIKRVYEVMAEDDRGSFEMRRLFAKGVGVGWLGYHSAIAGKALRGFVPEVFGLRNGILFSEWFEVSPLTVDDLTENVVERMSTYLARRGEQLQIREDPRSVPPYLGWGWLEILSILRRVYHPLLGYLKHAVLLEHLKRILRYRPTLVDGRMRPEEWVVHNGEILKLDYEQHCFGAPELDVVDPAYDVAMTSFEFSLSESDEEKMLESYSSLSGDGESIKERVFLYKLLFATAESDRLLHRIVSKRERTAPVKLNERLLWCWNFRVYAMNRFLSSIVRKHAHKRKNAGIFFTDIDGVLDSETLGFPHTSPSGLEALSLLNVEGYSVVPNTGRNCEHVRNYCLNYGFSSGIAEYGSVIIDLVQDSEMSLVDRHTQEELSACRDLLENIAGVFVDRGYRYSVRAFRYNRQGTVGLGVSEANELLRSHGFNRLKVIARKADTYFVGKETSKGRAADVYVGRSKQVQEIVAAIGDSDEDIPMLRKAKFSYAPANCSDAIKKLAHQGRCVVLPHAYQRGLLDAVRAFLRSSGVTRFDSPVNTSGMNSLQYLFWQLLTISEYSRPRKLFAALNTNGLGLPGRTSSGSGANLSDVGFSFNNSI